MSRYLKSFRATKAQAATIERIYDALENAWREIAARLSFDPEMPANPEATLCRRSLEEAGFRAVQALLFHPDPQPETRNSKPETIVQTERFAALTKPPQKS